MTGKRPPDSSEDVACNEAALLSPSASGTKVKSLLTGLPLTPDELSALEHDSEALRGLVEGWIELPETRNTLQDFFTTAFQQNGNELSSAFQYFQNARYSGKFDAAGAFEGDDVPEEMQGVRIDRLLNQNIAESFGRTMVHLSYEAESFVRAVDTDTFMMTTAMAVFLSYVDDVVVGDDGKTTIRTSADEFQTFTLVRDQTDAPDPLDALDPDSPDFGIFHAPDLAKLPAECNVASSQTVFTTETDPDSWHIHTTLSFAQQWILQHMFGVKHGVRRGYGKSAYCNAALTTPPVLSPDDFRDWRMVKIRPPQGAETAERFYDLRALREARELRLHTFRRGFFSTLGFQNSWHPNEENSARLTTNQLLIVALGGSFSGAPIVDFEPDSLDREHADPSTACYGCHQSLDPMRDFVRATWTNYYGDQLDPERRSLVGQFAFGGVQASGRGMEALAKILGEHPNFAPAWVQKLCFFANATACPSGPELTRVTQTFVDSGHDFRVLLRELFSSPLVSGASCEAGSDAAAQASIARGGQFCRQLSSRLGVKDVCGRQIALLRFNGGKDFRRVAQRTVESLADDSFSRGEIEPVTIRETSIMTRAIRERFCDALASAEGFDLAFGGESASAILDRLVRDVMAIPENDSRYQEARAVLEEHLKEASLIEDEETALRSAFSLACMAPASAGLGF